MVYNTWFDQFEVLGVPRLRRQLQAAKRLGSEVFVVDAGWYGPEADDWWSQAGDWRSGSRPRLAATCRRSGTRLARPGSASGCG